MTTNIVELEMKAVSALQIVKPEIRKEIIDITPDGTFRHFASKRMAKLYASGQSLRDLQYPDIAELAGLKVDEVISFDGVDTTAGDWRFHVSELLTWRQAESPTDKSRWAAAIIALDVIGKIETGSTKPATFLLKTGRDLRAMDIKTEWLIDGLIPRYSVVLLYGRGGIGKTTLIMMCADAIDRAMAIFGMTTVKTQVIVVDFENSLAVLSERAKRTSVDGVLFWDSGQNPPSLDKADWTAYQALLEQYPGALFVFDTLRSSHSGDENSSETMTIIMRRMRQLRDAGATVILLHHTPKGNDRQFKGSGAIFDLCDQTLALYQTAKPGSEQEADDDDDATDKVYRFGTGKKTRYRPHRVFLSFDTEREVFTLAKDPNKYLVSFGLVPSASCHFGVPDIENVPFTTADTPTDQTEHLRVPAEVAAKLKSMADAKGISVDKLLAGLIFEREEAANVPDMPRVGIPQEIKHLVYENGISGGFFMVDGKEHIQTKINLKQTAIVGVVANYGTESRDGHAILWRDGRVYDPSPHATDDMTLAHYIVNRWTPISDISYQMYSDAHFYKDTKIIPHDPTTFEYVMQQIRELPESEYETPGSQKLFNMARYHSPPDFNINFEAALVKSGLIPRPSKYDKRGNAIIDLAKVAAFHNKSLEEVGVIVQEIGRNYRAALLAIPKFGEAP